MTTEELLQHLKSKEKEIVVFGTGFVAEMFYQALDLYGLWSKIRFVVISNAQKGQQFHGKPVFSFDKASLTDNVLLCVAVHESARNALQGALKEFRDHCIWIYPNLYDLLYGMPIQPTKPVALSSILSQQNPREYWLAVRYAAIRDYLGQKQTYCLTKELYKKALSLHCGMETAVRRCKQMEELASTMAEEGFRHDCSVKIDEAGRIIDGLHRIACAACLQITSIPTVIYPSSPVYDRLLGERNRLPEHLLREAGFSFDELQFIQRAQSELLTYKY